SACVRHSTTPAFARATGSASMARVAVGSVQATARDCLRGRAPSPCKRKARSCHTEPVGRTGGRPMRPEELSDEEVFAAFPAVLIDRDNIAHYRGLLRGKLLINQCAACGYWIYPHRSLCPRCLSWDVKPTEVSGEGKV